MRTDKLIGFKFNDKKLLDLLKLAMGYANRATIFNQHFDEDLVVTIDHQLFLTELKTENLLDKYFTPVFKAPPKYKDNTWYVTFDSLTIDLFFHIKDGKGFGLFNTKWYTTQLNFDWDQHSHRFIEGKNPEVLSILVNYFKITNKGNKLISNDFSKYKLKKKNLIYDASEVNDPIYDWRKILNLRSGIWKPYNLPTPKPELPIINNVKGNIDEKGNLVYGSCGILRPEWFISSTTRQIVEMKLSSGVIINHEQITQVREFLKNDNKFSKYIRNAKDFDNAISLDDK